jgi:hypothetical protein
MKNSIADHTRVDIKKLYPLNLFPPEVIMV